VEDGRRLLVDGGFGDAPGVDTDVSHAFLLTLGCGACLAASREKDRIYVLTPSSQKWHMGIHEARKSEYHA
jgi:hypothetical protein